MQSNATTTRNMKSSFDEMLFPILVDVLLIIDVLLSVYYFFFNLSRTFKTGIWTVFGIQLIFLPLLILLTLVENRKKYSNTVQMLGNPIKASFKQPLAYSTEVKKGKSNVYTNPNEGYMSALRMGIFLFLAMDIIIILNFMFLGIMVDSIRGVDGGEIIIYYMLLDQAYYLPPILLMIFLYLRMKGASKIDEEITKWEPGLLTGKSSVRKKIKSKKELKRILLASMILFLLSFSLFAYANQNEDNQNSVIVLSEESQFVDIRIYGFIETSENIEIIAQGHTVNQYGKLYPQLVKLTYDLEDKKITDSKILMAIDRRDVLIDTIITNNEFYMLTFNSLDWNYKLFKYDLSTDTAELYYIWDLGISGSQEYIVNFSFFTYLLSPFEGGVHIIQTELPHPVPSVLTSNTTVRSVTDSGISDSSIDLIVLDAMVFEGKTYFLHFSSSFDNFDLTTYDGVGSSFSLSNNTHQTLTTGNSENVEGTRTPNSATLFKSNGALYYRSTENLFDISNHEDSGFKTELITDDYVFTYRGFPGVTSTTDFLFLNSERVVQYREIDSLSQVETAKGANAKYYASQRSNMVAYENSLLSSSNDGRIFIWDLNPSKVSQENDFMRNIIIAAVIIYLFSATTYFVLRRKLDLIK